MKAALAPRGDARTYLTHFVGDGLEDDRYVFETYRSLANGEIVPVHADGTPPKGRRKALGRILSLKAVKTLRPARDEIIIATGVKLRNCGCQYWGWRSLGLFRGAPPERLRRTSVDVPPARHRPAVRRFFPHSPTGSSRWPIAIPNRDACAMRSHERSEFFHGSPVWGPSLTVIEIAIGETHGPFDTEAEAIAGMVFAGLEFDEVEISNDAPITAWLTAWA